MNRISLLLFVLIALCLAILFFPSTLLDQTYLPVAKDITAALLGAFVTVAITATLLRFQAASEVNRDKSVAVFQEKLKIYEGFCSFLSEIARDGRLEAREEQNLRLWAMKMSLISGREVSEAIDHFFVQAHRYGTLFYGALSEPQRQDLIKWHSYFYGKEQSVTDPEQCFMSIGSLVAHLKHDLGEAEVSSLKDVASARHAVDDIVSASFET